METLLFFLFFLLKLRLSVDDIKNALYWSKNQFHSVLMYWFTLKQLYTEPSWSHWDQDKAEKLDATAFKFNTWKEVNFNFMLPSFLLKYYAPCAAIVLVSEIGFIIPVTVIPGRVGLLVTQFLTLINIFIHQMVSCYNNFLFTH